MALNEEKNNGKRLETFTIDSCPLCGSASYLAVFDNFDRLHHLPGLFKVARCGECTSLYLKNIPKDISYYYPEGEYYSFYEGNSSKLTLKNAIINSYYSGNPKRGVGYLLLYPLKNRIQGIPEFVRNGKVLDVGCGSGLLLDILKEIGWETYGLDIGQRAVELLEKKGHHGLCGEFRTDTYLPDSFDAVLMSHSIEHVRNPKEYIRLAFEKLKPGGELVLLAPNASSLGYKVFGKSWAPIETPRHLFVPSVKAMKSIIRDEGFHLESIRYTGCNWAQSLDFKVNGRYNPKSLFYNKYFVVALEGVAQAMNMFNLGDSFQINARKP